MSVSGINSEKMTQFKLELLDAYESLNSIFNRLEVEISSIRENWSGEGKSTLLAMYDEISNQVPIIKQNINSYALDIEKVIKNYELHDQELSQVVMSNISKLDEGRD